MRRCRLTPASSSTTARAAASGSSPNPAIAVCSVHTAPCRARRSSRTGSAVEAVSVALLRAPRRLPLCPPRHPPQSVAACLSIVAGRILTRMGTKSRETIYGGSVRAAAERATEARKEADRLAVEAWNKRMLGFQGPAQPSPALGDAINAGWLSRTLAVRSRLCCAGFGDFDDLGSFGNVVGSRSNV